MGEQTWICFEHAFGHCDFLANCTKNAQEPVLCANLQPVSQMLRAVFSMGGWSHIGTTGSELGSVKGFTGSACPIQEFLGPIIPNRGHVRRGRQRNCHLLPWLDAHLAGSQQKLI